MMSGTNRLAESRIQAAVAELEGRIRERFPEAAFSVWQGFGDDTEEVYLEAVTEVADTDEVLDLVIDRLVEMRVEEGIPINVHPRRRRDRPTAAAHAPQDWAAST